MNDQIERALATLADRGNDPGAAQVWARANADAPRRRRRTQVRAGAAGVAAVLVASFLVFALSAKSSGSQHVVVSEPPSPTAPTTSPAPVVSKVAIAFTLDNAIWTMEPDGSDVHRVTPLGCCSVSAWNPAHTELAVDYSGQLTIIRPDGTRVKSFDATTIFPPAWSPDGTQIAFALSPPGGSNGGPIEVVDVAGSSTTAHVLANVFAGAVSWSPDGTQIAYTSLDEPLHIEILTIATGESDPLHSHPRLSGEQFGPAWSRDGRIAFSTGNAIDSIRADGRNLRSIYDCQQKICDIVGPAWSPGDPSVIVFAQGSGAEPHLALLDVSAGVVHNIGPPGAQLPSW